jgi:hypothetical protein
MGRILACKSVCSTTCLAGNSGLLLIAIRNLPLCCPVPMASDLSDPLYAVDTLRMLQTNSYSTLIRNFQLVRRILLRLIGSRRTSGSIQWTREC